MAFHLYKTKHKNAAKEASVNAEVEYQSAFQHHPFQDSTTLLQNVNLCIDSSCNNEFRKAMGLKCKKKKVKHHSSSGSESHHPSSPRATIHHHKRVMVHLSKLESEEKIHYHVEMPLRAQLKMTNLMRTNHVLLNDPEFMDDVFIKVIGEEDKELRKITKLRKKTEADRMKRIIIDGHMIPPPGMEYLKKNPMYRVNRLLDRMDKLNRAFLTKPKEKLEPITQVEPFEFDGTVFFKELHANGIFWIPPEEIEARKAKLRGKIARAKLRLREKLARESFEVIKLNAMAEFEENEDMEGEEEEEEDDEYSYNADIDDDDADAEEYDWDHSRRKKEEQIALQQKLGEEKMKRYKAKMKELDAQWVEQEIHFRKKMAKLRKQDNERKLEVVARQKIRDAKFLNKSDIEKQAFIDKFNQQRRLPEIMEDIFLVPQPFIKKSPPATVTTEFQSDRENLADYDEMAGEDGDGEDHKNIVMQKKMQAKHEEEDDDDDEEESDEDEDIPTTPSDENDPECFHNIRKQLGIRFFQVRQKFETPALERFRNASKKANAMLQKYREALVQDRFKDASKKANTVLTFAKN